MNQLYNTIYDVIDDQLTFNPFLNGYFHTPYSIYLSRCTNEKILEKLETEQPGLENEDYRNPLSQESHIAYWSGRTLRFIVNLPCAIIDLALQVMQLVAFALDYALMTIERKVRNCSKADLYWKPYFEFMYQYVRMPFMCSLDYLAQDVGLLDKEIEISFNNRHFDFVDLVL